MSYDLLGNYISIDDAKNNPLFSRDYDYGELLSNKDKLSDEWKSLRQEEKEKFNNSIKVFYERNKLIDPSSSIVSSSKNYYLLDNEINERISNPPEFKLLLLDGLHYEDSLMELVENIENIDQIKELYKLRKKTVGRSKNAGISADEALRLRNCMRQGRELYQTGKVGSLMVKPLNYFYSITAYAYSIIILNNPVRYSLNTLPGSHGVNYIPDGMKIQFGGDMPHGTFSDLFCSFPTFQIKNNELDIIQENTESIMTFFHKRNTVNVGTLMSMIPEIRDYYKLVSGESSKTYPLQIIMTRDARNVKWEFQIGDGETKPNVGGVQSSFQGFNVSERHGKYLIDVPASEVHKIKASIFTDIKGDLWYIDNPFFPIVLPEVCIHFLLTNIFSNLMRYTPHNWGEVLLNEVNSNWSLITRKYLSAFESKFPQIVLKSLSKYYPYVIGG
ncbi:YaaC family protein [Dickeya dadantii]|uniref:YaaC family protein n=1 Tax=Dickeya dadantii TaxID=204038 RepID=UPI001C0BAB9D|nr:YaaC family protein [Dickeya dadantii]QWT41964.1 YaaC family protein [Dickeya dadantii]